MDVKANLWSWKEKNNFSNPIFRSLAEAYRRSHQFHNGNYSYELLLPEITSRMKKGIDEGYFKPVGREIPKITNWYSLTEKGVNMMQELEKLVGEWSEDKNMIFWNL